MIDQTIHKVAIFIIVFLASWVLGLGIALWREIRSRPQVIKGQIPPGLSIGAWYYLLRGWYGNDGEKMLSVADAWYLAFYLSILQGMGGRYWFPLYGNKREVYKQRVDAWEMLKAIQVLWNAIGFIAAIKWRYPVTETTKLLWIFADRIDSLPMDVTLQEVRLPGVQNACPETWECGYSKSLDVFYVIDPFVKETLYGTLGAKV